MKDHSPNNSVFEITIQLIFLLAIIVWCLMVITPFASIILWSLILALAFYPLHKSLSMKLKHKPKLASVIIILGIIIILIIPTGLIINELVDEVKVLKISYDNGEFKVPPPSESVREWPLIGDKFFTLWKGAFENMEGLIMKYKEQLLGLGSYLVNGILGAMKGLVQILISLVIAGVILSTGGIYNNMLKFFRKIGGKFGDEIAEITMKTVSSVVKGVIGEALVIALLNGIVFLLAGVPYAGIWALFVFILAVLQLPVFIITVPVILYLFGIKETGPAVFWTVLLLLVSFSDNFLTPLMLGKNAPVPMAVIFIGVIGGCILSGFIGIFTGAIVISVGYTLLIKWLNTGSAGLENKAA